MAGAEVASESITEAQTTAADEKRPQNEAAIAALAAFKAAVDEVRRLKGQEENEDTMREATSRVAAAMQAALQAGVPKAELVEASKGPVEVGQYVEIHGLESESGKLLNGKAGVVTLFIEDKGRYQIQLGPDSFVSIKAANLRRIAPPPADEDTGQEQDEEKDEQKDDKKASNGHAAQSDNGHAQPENAESRSSNAQQTFLVGSRVEVKGLESESGMKLNGRVGHITEYLSDKERYKIQLSVEEHVSIKEANLIPRSPLPRQDGSASSSSSSDDEDARKKVEEKKRKKEAKQNFSSKKAKKDKKTKTADDALDRLLGNAQYEETQAQKAARKAGEAAAKAAAEASEKAAAWAAAEMAKALHPGDRVEVHSLQSESGKKLNGKTGVVKRFIAEKGRWEVDLFQASLQSLKPDNLKRLGRGSSSGDSSGGSAFINNDYSGPSAGYTLL